MKLLSLLLIASTAYALDPYPPTSGPPAPIMVGLEVVGPTSVRANSGTRYILEAKFSDATRGIVTNAVWTVSGSFAATVLGDGWLVVEKGTEGHTVMLKGMLSGMTKEIAIEVVESPAYPASFTNEASVVVSTPIVEWIESDDVNTIYRSASMFEFSHIYATPIEPIEFVYVDAVLLSTTDLGSENWATGQTVHTWKMPVDYTNEYYKLQILTE